MSVPYPNSSGRPASRGTHATYEKEAVKEALKKSKYALIKPECSLTEKQKVTLIEVVNVCPDLAEMHRQKESFRNIFEVVNDWETGLD